MEHSNYHLFRHEIAMRWGDMDALGHLNNTYYFRYMEQARVSWLDDIGCPIEPNGIGPVLASTRCDYRKQLVYPATICLDVYTGRVGSKSLTLYHRFSSLEAPDTLFAEGEVVLVWVNYATGETVPLPEIIRQTVTPPTP